jgi:hypothetical protein
LISSVGLGEWRGGDVIFPLFQSLFLDGKMAKTLWWYGMAYHHTSRVATRNRNTLAG